MVNLIQDESPLLAHFGKDRTQQWFLVRLKEPDGEGGSGTKTSPAAADRAAHIIIIVPADAEVFFDGKATTETGAERKYRTAELDRGTTYRYSVRAVWTHAGRPIRKTCDVSFKAGSRIRVNFTHPLPARQE
jgi:uncharacterized protein (TIGR03000 family)